jgi:pantoate ligase / CMP/dCMP kinase
MPYLITQPAGIHVLASVPRPLGFVPTMGALHRGHFSLLSRARRECATVVASIYVNPLQFGPQEDFNRYPRSLREDVELCEEAGVDFVFAPQQLSGSTLVVPPNNLTQVLCGQQRPGHFTGVATVVLQLLNLVRPDRAYFGQKDIQQCVILQKIVRDLYLGIGIIPCATIRELNGLALSSRNRYLSETERKEAAGLYQALSKAEALFLQGEQDPERLRACVLETLQKLPEIRAEYVEVVDPVTLQPVTTAVAPTLLTLAAHVGKTRLIDNLRLTQQKAPIIAIDGPAGSGKSTVAKAVAQALNFLHLDTGAMYRAVTWAALSRQVPLTADRLTLLTREVDIQLQPSTASEPMTRIWVDGTEVTTQIRSQLVTAQVSTVAAVPGVRQVLVAKQQALGAKGGVVMEGRDIGTQVFPQAELKIFLTASPQERAQRRQRDLTAMGETVPDLAELTQQIQERDHADSTRSTAPLIQAPDALVVITDDLTVAQVVARITDWAKYL